jgi:hypothetical protein
MPHRVHDMATATRQRLQASAAASGHPQLQAAVSVRHRGTVKPNLMPCLALAQQAAAAVV